MAKKTKKTRRPTGSKAKRGKTKTKKRTTATKKLKTKTKGKKRTAAKKPAKKKTTTAKTKTTAAKTPPVLTAVPGGVPFESTQIATPTSYTTEDDSVRMAAASGGDDELEGGYGEDE